MNILGIDIGGSGIKGAPVNTKTGDLLAPRHRISTPRGSKPDDVAAVVGEIASYFRWTGEIGCGFPGVVRVRSRIVTAANLSKKWIGLDAAALFAEKAACPVTVTNDADAAGMAEMQFGAGMGHNGVVLLVTVGTGLGTALFTNGILVPNTELGHIELDGRPAEDLAADSARETEGLSWKQWAKRFDRYLRALEKLVWPDLIIIGGGASDDFAKFAPYLSVSAEITHAALHNNAGIVGAALAAARTERIPG